MARGPRRILDDTAESEFLARQWGLIAIGMAILAILTIARELIA